MRPQRYVEAIELPSQPRNVSVHPICIEDEAGSLELSQRGYGRVVDRPINHRCFAHRPSPRGAFIADDSFGLEILLQTEHAIFPAIA
jgi:hypothetical protein